MNRDSSKGGGVSTSFCNTDAAQVLKIKEGERNELLVTRIEKFLTPINIVNIYGKNECRTNKEEIVEDWEEVLEILAKIEALDEFALVIGDMNKLVGNIIKGNHEKISVGGALVRELLSSGKYVLVNSLDNVEGGPFTRYEPNDFNNREKRSCLDLAIISKD